MNGQPITDHSGTVGGGVAGLLSVIMVQVNGWNVIIGITTTLIGSVLGAVMGFVINHYMKKLFKEEEK